MNFSSTDAVIFFVGLTLVLVCFGAALIFAPTTRNLGNKARLKLEEAILLHKQTGVKQDHLLEQAADLCNQDLAQGHKRVIDRIWSLILMARICLQQDLHEEALFYLDDGLSLELNMPYRLKAELLRLNLWKGHVYKAMGDFQEANKAYRLVIYGDVDCGLVGAELLLAGIRGLLSLPGNQFADSDEMRWLKKRENQLHEYLMLDHSGQF